MMNYCPLLDNKNIIFKISHLVISNLLCFQETLAFLLKALE